MQTFLAYAFSPQRRRRSATLRFCFSIEGQPAPFADNRCVRRRFCIWTFLWWLRPAGRRTVTAALAQTLSRRAGPDQNVITPPSQCHAGQQNLTAASKWNALNELTSTGSSVAHTFRKKEPTVCHFSNPACARRQGKHAPVPHWIPLGLLPSLTVICRSEYKPLS